MNDNAPRLGAALAFYTLLSFAPVIVISIAVVAVFYGEAAAQGQLASQIEGVAGPIVARTIQETLRGLQESGLHQPHTGLIATGISLLALAFAASTMFVELQDALNTIWHVPPGKDATYFSRLLQLIRGRLRSFALVLAVGLVLLVSLVCDAWTTAINIAMPPMLRFVAMYLVVLVVFAGLYKLIPDVTIRWGDVAGGAILTAFLFMTGRQILTMYFASAGFSGYYSVAGSPAVVLLWVYYSAQIFFWGAEFCKVYATTAGSHSRRAS